MKEIYTKGAKDFRSTYRPTEEQPDSGRIMWDTTLDTLREAIEALGRANCTVLLDNFYYNSNIPEKGLEVLLGAGMYDQIVEEASDGGYIALNGEILRMAYYVNPDKGGSKAAGH